MGTKNSIAVYDFLHLGKRYLKYGGFSFESISTLLHQHLDFYEIILITSGEFLHTFENTATTLPSGTLLLFKPGVTHQLFTEPNKSTHFVMCVEQQYFEQRVAAMFPDFDLNSFEHFTFKPISKDKLTYLERLGNTLCRDFKSNISMAEEFLFLCVSDFMFYNSTLDCEFYVDDIIQKLNNLFYMNVSAKDIYSQYPYSESVLLHEFKKRTGMTIAEYRTQQKMKYACQLLTESEQKVIDIAVSLNYSGLSYFLRTFKKYYGMSPSEYRKKYKNS